MIPFAAAVDWGTSSFRLWLLGHDGAVLAETRSGEGMMAAREAGFSAVLERHLEELSAPAGLPVIVCGMAGAKQGWREAAYLDTPAALADVIGRAVRVEDAVRDVRILPGVAQRDPDWPDVMRGEETQLIGAIGQGVSSGLVCMPGTHSKWARLDGTRIEHFSTAMTGEMFALLKSQSVLRHSLNGPLDGPGQDEGFVAGARDGLDNPAGLLGQLFTVRAASLLSGQAPDWCAGYLSGLLIGTEIAANRNEISTDPVPLIGSDKLCALYMRVLHMAGASGRLVDSTEVVLAGLTAARASIA